MILYSKLIKGFRINYIWLITVSLVLQKNICEIWRDILEDDSVHLGTPYKIKPIVFLSHISDHLRKVSLHELNVKKIALHQMVTHEHHSQPLFGNIKRKFNGFHIWLLFSLTRLWHVHNSRSIFSIFYCEWGNSSCIVFGYQHFIAFIHGEEKLR